MEKIRSKEMVFPPYIHMEKIWKIPLSYIGHCTGFSALKGSCTATAKRDVFQGVPQVVPDASLWNRITVFLIFISYVFCFDLDLS